MGWRLQRDLLALDGVRLRLHRIGLSHWRAGTRLRSWAVAPLHRTGDALHVACSDGEALWLGAWLDEENGGPASVRLQANGLERSATIHLPADFQLTALTDAQGRHHALARSGTEQVGLRLLLQGMGDQAAIALQLHAPAAWSALAGRPEPAPLHGPPPLPPRLG